MDTQTGQPTHATKSRKVMVGGPYRYVRNPMYVSYFVAIIGETLLLSRPVLFIYLLVVVAFVAGFVHWWEEPTMARRFGGEYEAYRRLVATLATPYTLTSHRA